MVDLEKIRTDIENLRTLNAEEYCREEIAKIYADFEASRERKIKELETALDIFERYQVVETAEEVVEEENQEVTEA